MYYFFYLPVVPAADILGATTMISTTATTNTLNTSGRVQSLIQKIKDFVTKQQHHIQNFVNKNKNHFQKIAQGAFMFGNFMRTLFQFFPIIILARIIVGLFQRPMEYIMMGISIIILSIVYVIYYILSIKPLIYIPYAIWFLIFSIFPLLLQSLVLLALFIVLALFCLILATFNWMSGGKALRNMILCQNGPYSWYKTPNHHLKNKYERSIFCSKPCIPGYYPDSTGISCVKNPKGQPSFCPYPEIMRLHTTNKNDFNYYYKDYRTTGNLNYLSSTPEKRERLLKEYYINRINFINQCDEKFKDKKYIPLSICSSLDAMSNKDFNKYSSTGNAIDPITLNKLKTICSQGFCNSKNNYPFCSFNNYEKEKDKSRIKDIIKMIIYIILFVIICSIILIYFNEKKFLNFMA
jgi:hypothetical protein